MTTAIAEGLYTQEQLDYVAGIKDEDLRSHLLHQTRMKDNMECDRNGFEKLLIKNNLKDKIIIDLENFRNDKSEGSNYYGWQANIAMAFKDRYSQYKQKESTSAVLSDWDIHKIANQAAKNFLDTLCIKPTAL